MASTPKRLEPEPMKLGFTSPTVLARGDGSFVVKAGKPAAECDSMEAARILGMARSSVANLLNHPTALRYVRWRWTSPARGKRLFEVASLYEYIRATRDPEFGEGETRPQKSQASRS
jgi:hypothetical protein